jgi:hypothetical protein
MFEVLDTMTGKMRAQTEHQKPELLACVTLMPTGKAFMDYELIAPLFTRYKSLGICTKGKSQ